MVIRCDHCQIWFHRVCANLLVRQVRFFEKNSDFKWYCKKCFEHENPVQKHHEKKRFRKCEIEKESIRLERILENASKESDVYKDLRLMIEQQTCLKIENLNSGEVWNPHAKGISSQDQRGSMRTRSQIII